MTKNFDFKRLLSQWRLSESTQAILARNSDIVESLIEDRQYPPFPEEYTPYLIDFLFDERRYVRLEKGKLTELKSCEECFQPDFIEIRFDGECALFLCNGEEIVNRLHNIAQLDEILQQANLTHLSSWTQLITQNQD